MSKTLTPAEAARMKADRQARRAIETVEDIRCDVESIFFMFDALRADDTKAALLRLMNKLGSPMQWDPDKGVDAPAPLHVWASEMGLPCRCFECGASFAANDSREQDEVRR